MFATHTLLYVLFVYVASWYGYIDEKIKIAYNNGLSRLLNFPKCNSASEMFVNINIPSFIEML